MNTIDKKPVSAMHRSGHKPYQIKRMIDSMNATMRARTARIAEAKSKYETLRTEADGEITRWKAGMVTSYQAKVDAANEAWKAWKKETGQ